MTRETIRTWVNKVILWSFVVTLPIVVIGGYTLHQTWKRYATFSVRYENHRINSQLPNYLEYQIGTVKRKIASVFSPAPQTELPTIRLSVEKRALATLNHHLPQSGFEYVKGTLLNDGKQRKVKIRYRGDNDFHWAFEKKSIRVKTKKDDLFQGMRAFNLMAPKFTEQLNNFLAYQLAEQMELLGPKSELVRVFINGEDRGVQVLVEQLEELTLRRNAKMPGDIYRGELIAKDRFRGIGDLGVNLWGYAGFWDKVSINNHYPDASAKPMEELIRLIQSPDRMQAQARMGDLLDMQAWGKYSAYESLVLTFHIDSVHNWRLYYDPWRQKLVPVVWDPVGWHGVLRRPEAKKPAFVPVIHGELRRMLFKNGEFLKAREATLEEFFGNGGSEEFLANKDRAVATFKSEIGSDKYLRPQDPDRITRSVDKFSAYIDAVFADGRRQNERLASMVTYAEIPRGIRLSVDGAHSVKRVMFKFPDGLSLGSDVILEYQTKTGADNPVSHTIDLASAVQLSGSELILNTSLLPNTRFRNLAYMAKKQSKQLEYSPGIYDIVFDSGQSPASVWVDLGTGWKRISNVPGLDMDAFNNIYAPAAEPRSKQPVVWSGEKLISGVETIDDPLIIAPGTTVRLAEDASLILRNQITAIGTEDKPIRFLRRDESAQPWGAIGLIGEAASGSKFAHCQFDGGSGYKGDLFEYSGMFSVHDVQDLVVEDCEFSNGTIVDDMVHIVYSTAEFVRTVFRNSYSDAFDIDISEAWISESVFEASGNDAVDLMSSVAMIDNTRFIDSGDKGISVGEGSTLLGVNNTLVNNEIGVQSKDGSNAFLYNHSFVKNRQALHAYKKNWRYGAGGEIMLFKSSLIGNDQNVTAERKSNIVVFDSYSDTPVIEAKRVQAFAVDGDNESAARHEGTLLPEGMRLNKRNKALMRRFDKSVLKLRDKDRRGAM